MTLVIRPAVEADRPLIARLHAASWRDAYRGIVDDRFLDEEAEAERSAHWAARAWGPEDVARIAESEGRPAGFVFAEVGAEVYIDNLHLLAEARGRGIGPRLLREVGLAAGGRRAFLKVFAANAAARRFYARLGGREVGEETRVSFGRENRVVVVEWPDAAALATASAGR